MHDPNDRSFLGHPRGLGYIAFGRTWGALFLLRHASAAGLLRGCHRLLLPGHVEQVAGFGVYHRLINSIYGNLSTQPLASAIFGHYTSLVYLTPIAGGLIADRWLGRTRTITIGALLMSAGHFLMAFDVTFLLALTCLLCGVGCFKGNLASQVGALYTPGDNRRADAFQNLLHLHQRRSHRRAAHRRNARRDLWLALGLRRSRRRNVDRSDHLFVRPKIFAAQFAPLSKRRKQTPTTLPRRNSRGATSLRSSC